MSAPPELPDTPTPEQQADYDAAVARREGAIALAVTVMWALSGRQFGICPVIARPCPPGDPLRPWGGYSAVIVWDGSNWLNAPCGCMGVCRYSGPRKLHLPGPVQSIVTVTIAGVDLDPAAYTLEGDVLYLDRSWPSQDLGRPLGEAGTWSITYERGRPVPSGADRLTGILAAEFDKACSGDNKCRLPRQVTSMSRQGVSYQMYDPTAFYSSGKTSIPEIDMWLAAINPNHIMAGPVVV